MLYTIRLVILGALATLAVYGQTWTMNVPTASSTVLGALSPADWQKFNAKYGSGANATLNTLTIKPLSDAISVAILRNSAVQSNNMVEFQSELKVFLSGITKDGTFKQAGVTDGCATWKSGVLVSTGAKCGSGVAASGAIAVQANGSAVGMRGVVDFVSGAGIFQTITDTGTKLTVQTDVGAAVQTKSTDQSGLHVYCSAGSANTLTCSLSPVLSTYTNGMLVNLCVAGSITGATTLNIDSLGAKAVLSFAGSNPSSSDLGAGCRLVTYQASDNSFRLPAGGRTGGVVTTNASIPMPIGGCAYNAQGVVYAWGISTSGGVSNDCRAPDHIQPALSYSNAISGYAAYSFRIPQDWDGGTTDFVFYTANPSGDVGSVRFDISIACVSSGVDYQTGFSFNTAQSVAYANPPAGTYQARTAANLAMTGCAVGSPAIIKVYRDDTVSGNMGNIEYVMFPELRYTRQ